MENFRAYYFSDKRGLVKINRAAFLALAGSMATSALAACSSDSKTSADAGSGPEGGALDMQVVAADASMDLAVAELDAASNDAAVDATADAMLPWTGDAGVVDYCANNFACEFGQVACVGAYAPGFNTDAALAVLNCATLACEESTRTEQYDVGVACVSDVFKSSAPDTTTATYCASLMVCDTTDADAGVDGTMFTTELCERAFAAVGAAVRDNFISIYPAPDWCFTEEQFVQAILFNISY